MKVSIRPDHCIALRLIAAQEHYRKSQDWLNMVPEWERLVEVASQSQEIIKMQAAEIEKLRAALIKAGNGLLDADAKIKNMLAVLDSLIRASVRLSIAAQTTGGVAGRDEGLCAAIDNFAQPLANARAAAAALKETGDE